MGAHRIKDTVYFSYITEKEEAGVILYDTTGRQEKLRIAFPADYTVGTIRCMAVEGLPAKDVIYSFYEDGQAVTDERSRCFLNCRKYGEEAENEPLPAVLSYREYDWGDDTFPKLAYEDSIVYCMHVRGFTRHASSGVKGKGTFLGIQEKIPYLKELGVTTLELQPVYEFPEIEILKPTETVHLDAEEKRPERLHYWGYIKGCYYSPKSAYAYSRDAATELKNLIKELHKNNMEVILQFYFTQDILSTEIAEILRFWVMEYHVDGFHLKGKNIDPALLSLEPALAASKLWYYGFPDREVKGGKRFLAEYKDDFRNDSRRFLKGDEGMIPVMMHYFRANSPYRGVINYLTNYDGFTLMDLVSYDRKHNEDNNENNQDGTDSNFSWNCGQEGPSRKKTIVSLRLQQIKNALLMLFLAQGTPLIFMGDEFGNSQKGNNNPYCQDNDTTWLNWKNLNSNKEIYSFMKKLIAFRKEHGELHQKKPLRMMDYKSCGYPDLSYHGEFPWKPDTTAYSRQLGMMYCGRYGEEGTEKQDEFLYVAYNLHWEPHEFALPRLPKDKKWKTVLSSVSLAQKETQKLAGKEAAEESKKDMEADAAKDADSRDKNGQDTVSVQIPPRCICVFCSEA